VAEPGSRLGTWVNALESSEAVKNTVSSSDLYLDSYERYAGTSRGSPSALLIQKDPRINVKKNHASAGINNVG